MIRFEGYHKIEQDLAQLLDNNCYSFIPAILPFLRRMFYIELPQDCNEWESDDSDILQNVIPVWNLKHIKERHKSSKELHKSYNDKYRYELLFDIQEKQLVLNEQDIEFLLKEEDNKISLVLTKRKSHLWNFISFHEVNYEAGFRIFSNKVNSNIRYSKRDRIRTKAELFHKASTLIEATNSNIHLVSVNVCNNSNPKRDIIAEGKLLVGDNFGNYQKPVMELYFSMPTPSDIYAYDIIQAITNYIQYYFPEYNCIGLVQ